MKDEYLSNKNWTRRAFLRTAATVPTLSLINRAVDAQGSLKSRSVREYDESKFTPLDLSPYLNCSSSDLGPHPRARALGGESAHDNLIRTPGGDQRFRGIPFRLGPENLREKQWLMLSMRSSQNSTRSVQISFQQRASSLCMAAFCDWDKNEVARPI